MPTTSKTATRQRAVRKLEFVCPRCGLDRAGAEVTVRRWWHIAGVPVLPLGEPYPGVVCATCEHRYDVDVLEIPTTTELVLVLEAATVAAAVALVAATPHDRVDSVRDCAIRTLVDNGFDYDHDRFALATVTVSSEEGAAQVRRLRHELTQHGKQGLLHRLTNVVMHDAAITAGQRDALVDIGRQLGLSVVHVNGMLAVAGVPADA